MTSSSHLPPVFPLCLECDVCHVSIGGSIHGIALWPWRLFQGLKRAEQELNQPPAKDCQVVWNARIVRIGDGLRCFTWIEWSAADMDSWCSSYSSSILQIEKIDKDSTIWYNLIWDYESCLLHHSFAWQEQMKRWKPRSKLQFCMLGSNNVSIFQHAEGVPFALVVAPASLD